MKTGLFTVAALSAVAAAQPAHQHRHNHPAKRQVIEYVTEQDVVTVTAGQQVVYVDGNGNPVSTSYEDMGGVPGATETVAWTSTAAAEEPKWTPPAAAPESNHHSEEAPAYVAPAAVTSEAAAVSWAPPAYSAPEASSAPAPASPPASSDSGSSSGSAGYGISYSPYGGSSGCKSQDEVNSDFEKISGYGMVRIYGTDCNQVSTVMSAAASKNMKIFAGVFNIDKVVDETNAIIAAAKGNWAAIDTVSIGNELVNNKQKSVEQVVAAMNTARGMLKDAGYTGHVVTVDTFSAMQQYPALCEASDYAAVNCHAFFDPNTSADEAGDFVLDQAQKTSVACGGKNTMITESGWPWSGSVNGKAIPSRENQQTALASLKSKFASNIILFTAFDDTWKQNNAYTFNAEQFWGFLSN